MAHTELIDIVQPFAAERRRTPPKTYERRSRYRSRQGANSWVPVMGSFEARYGAVAFPACYPSAGQHQYHDP
jgi:hypothetical protein